MAPRVPRRKLSIAPDSILNRKSLVSSEESSNFRLGTICIGLLPARPPMLESDAWLDKLSNQKPSSSSERHGLTKQA